MDHDPSSVDFSPSIEPPPDAGWLGDLIGSVFGESHGPAPALVGDPGGDADHWRLQQTPATCAIVSQQMILEQFGIEVSEAQLMYEAMSYGWFTPAGTSPEDVGALLELHGVGTHTVYGGDVESLAMELAKGHKVIVGVDSGEIWGQDFFFEDWLKGDGVDHAIVVTGIDVSDPDNPMVYINDPGDPNGAAKAYPLADFLDAWDDSGRMYVATDEAPPDLSGQERIGTNYNAETGLYMDAAWWRHFLANFVDVAKTVVVVATLAQIGIEMLDDAGRDQLLAEI